MAASVRQFKYVDNSASAAQNWTGAFDSAVLAGSLIVVAYSVYGTTTDPSSISDNLNAGNYTQDKKGTQNTNSGDILWLYSYPNSAAGAVTVSFAGPAAFYQAGVLMEIVAAATSSPVDASNTGVGSIGGVPATFTLTTLTDNDIIIAAAGYYSGTLPTLVAGSGLTVIQQNTHSAVGHVFATMKHEDAGAAGANTITFSYSGGIGDAQSALTAVAYKITTSSPSQTPAVGAGTLSGVAGRMDSGVFPRSTLKGT